MGNASHHQELNHHLFLFLNPENPLLIFTHLQNTHGHDSQLRGTSPRPPWHPTGLPATTPAPACPKDHQPELRCWSFTCFSLRESACKVRPRRSAVHRRTAQAPPPPPSERTRVLCHAPPPPQSGPRPRRDPAPGERSLPAPSGSSVGSHALGTSQVGPRSTGLRDSLPSHLSHRLQGPTTSPRRVRTTSRRPVGPGHADGRGGGGAPSCPQHRSREHCV